MFRLNGDVIKQLNIIYKVSFKEKYKNELKDRIFIFLDSVFSKQPFSFSFIKQIEPLVELKDNKPYKISELFFKEHKDALFNSFNPLWYNSNKEKTYFKDETIYEFLEKQLKEIKNKIRGQTNPDVNCDLFIEKELKSFIFFENKMKLKLSVNSASAFLDYLKKEKILKTNLFRIRFEENKRTLNINTSFSNSLITSGFVFLFELNYKNKNFRLFKDENLLDKIFLIDEKPYSILCDTKNSVAYHLRQQLKLFVYRELLNSILDYIKK